MTEMYCYTFCIQSAAYTMTPENISHRIAYILHAPLDEPAGKSVKLYIDEKFDDVDIIVPDEDLPPFPKSAEEVNARYMREIYEPLVAPLLTRAIEKTAQLGYGAVCNASFGDVGVNSKTKQGHSPVAGLGWSNFQMALNEHNTFSLIHTYTPEIAYYFEDLVKQYRLEEQCASIEIYDVDLSQHLTIGQIPDLDLITELTLPCIERAVNTGAEVILIGCGGQFWSRFAPILSRSTLENFGVRVLPPIDTMFEYCRSLMNTAEGAST